MCVRWIDLKNPNTKDHVLYDFIYGNVQKRQIYIDRKWVSGHLEMDVGMESDCKWAPAFFLG